VDKQDQTVSVPSDEPRSPEKPLRPVGQSGRGEPRHTLKEIREEIAFKPSGELIELIDVAGVTVQDADEALRLARARLLSIAYIDLNRWREWRCSVDPLLSAAPQS
jgi:hypothetical protein